VSYYANRAERLDLIVGLQALANFLKENEEVPSPRWIDVMVFPMESRNDAARREVERVAALIGSVAQDNTAGQYLASRKFGPIEYRVIAIPASPEESQE
jgi:hypothetical protein